MVGLKLAVTGWDLLSYKRTGKIPNENNLSKVQWAAMVLLLAAAYGLPALGILIPQMAVLGVMGLAFLTGLVFIPVIWRFDRYPEVYKAFLSQAMNQMDKAKHDR